MTLPSIVDVAIGLVLMFFILASLGSVLAEFVAAHQKLRHKLLFRTVTRLLEPETTKKFWRHPLILPLYSRTPPGERRKTKAPLATASAEKADDTAPVHPKIAPKKSWAVVRLWRWLSKKARLLKIQTAEAPAYLDGKLFASVVLDLATGEGAVGRVPSTTAWACAIRTHIPSIPGENNDLQDRLLALLRQVPPDATDCGDALKNAVARWYDEAMTRTSGEYRREMQKWLFFIGCGLAVLFNCDALRIATVLYQSPTLRAQVAQQAETLVQEKTPAAGQPAPVADDTGMKAQLKENIGQLRDLTKIGFPIGWSPVWRDNFILKPEPVQAQDNAAKAPPAATPTVNSPSSWFPEWPEKFFRFIGTTFALAIEPGLTSWLAKIAGLFATAFAVCLGAPFWFDLLGRLVKMRSSAGSDAEKKKTDDPGSAPGSAGAAGVAPTPPSTPSGTSTVKAPRQLPSLLDALGSAATGFSADRAYWLAQAADHAYETNRDTARTWLSQQGQTSVQFIEISGTNTQAFLSWGNGVALLAFRGTEQNLTDWTTDAKFKPIPADAHGLPGKIHFGFAEALESIWPDLLKALDQIKGQRVLLHVTGHSLGGALATLAALRLARLRTVPIQSVHTYGSPRVGDETFAREFDAVFTGRAFRVVNNEDLVTRIPPRETGYKHVNAIVYIDEAGRIQRDIGYWYRFLNFVTNALEDLKKALQTTVKDHSMTLYCGHLERAARNPDNVI